MPAAAAIPPRCAPRCSEKLAPLLSKRRFHRAELRWQAVKIDRAALSERHEVLLAARNTPEEYVQTEYFRRGQLPTQISGLWDAPEAVDDLQLLDVDGAIALSFTAKDAGHRLSGAAQDPAHAERHCRRAQRGRGRERSSGRTTAADPGTEYAYSILPRHHLLYESGTVLTGRESEAVEYRPSLARRIFG